MATKKEIYSMGYNRGYGIASCRESKDSEFDGLDYNEARDKFMQDCYEAEDNSRQFSPFEFTARELNDLIDTKPYDPWWVFDDGIYAGMDKGWREFSSSVLKLRPSRRPRS
jgi:hypothetical protein